MKTLANTVFKGLVREAMRVPGKSYRNSQGVIQSSVGLIFKIYSKNGINSIENILEQ
jgi:hypothetical protein